MQHNECFELGYVAKLHGYKGEVSLFLDVTNPDDYSSLDAVYIDLNGQLTPFFVESFALKNKGFAAVKFEGVNSENDAKAILRKSCYLPASILPQLDDKHFYDHEVVGFTLYDTNYGAVGKIEQIIDLSVNPLIQVMAGDKEVLIPFVQNLVQHVNRIEKTLTVTAPAGLIDLYING